MMALVTVKTYAELGRELVLAPERYDPRRESLQNGRKADGVPLAELVTTVRKTVSPTKNGGGTYLVLDTSDAREGIVIAQKVPVKGEELGSAKKVVQAGDVIISRLRPYLRQVAYVDPGIPGCGPTVELVCSTEFHVLRSARGEQVGFLVGFLLSKAVQDVLAAAQEGGHHPRFNESVLLGLPVPRSLVEQAKEMSATITKSVKLYRESERAVSTMIAAAEAELRPKVRASRGPARV